MTESIHPDLLEPERITQHFRDLNNLSELLDYDGETQKFIDKLIEAGWSREKIVSLQNIGAYGTIYEAALPHIFSSTGSRSEYYKNKGRIV